MRNKAIYTAVFFNYIGYYVCLLLLFNFGLGAMSLGVSIPLRLLILFSLLIFFRNSNHLKTNSDTYIFLFFSLIYIIRIVIDTLNDLPYYLDTTRVILYFLSFDMIPFLLLCNIKFKRSDFTIIKKSIIFSGFLFASLSLIFYKNYIGSVGRLTTDTADAELLSPLALSYCSSLVIGITVSYWMEHQLPLQEKIFYFLLIILSIVPFFLGASRGSLIALILPFILNLMAKKKSWSKFRLIVSLTLVTIGIGFLSEMMGSSLIERFISTGSDIEEGNDSAVRTVMWNNAFTQFLENPIMGDRLKVTGFDIYPHNIMIEILQSTGFLGFLPFIILITLVFKKLFKILKYAPQFSWISVLFIQCLTQNMFSGSIFSASWLMMSMAIVIAFARNENLSEIVQKPAEAY